MANSSVLNTSRQIFPVLSLLAGLIGSTVTAAGEGPGLQTIPPGYHLVASESGVPAEALYSVSLAETSRKLPHGERPWPWTLNVAGKGYRYNTRQEAYDALLSFMRRYPLKRIDVGIAQVNLGWNGAYFSSYYEALEPYTNLRVAARILKSCYDSNPGSWIQAAGCYHHPAGGKPARTYKAIVKRKLATLDLSTPVSYSELKLARMTGRNRWTNDRECKSTILFNLAGMPVRAPAFFAGGLIWRDIPVKPRFPSSLTASNEFVSHPGAMPRQGQVPFQYRDFMSHIHLPSVCEKTDNTLTPEQENRVRHLVHEECYSRDRTALIKLIGLMLLLKLAGTLMLGMLLLVLRLF